jgi:hypothetical protein
VVGRKIELERVNGIGWGCHILNYVCVKYISEGRDRLVGIATGYVLDGLGFVSQWGGGEIFRTRPDQPWSPPTLVDNGYKVPFPRLKRSGRGVDYPLHVAPRLKKECSCPLGHRLLF